MLELFVSRVGGEGRRPGNSLPEYWIERNCACSDCTRGIKVSPMRSLHIGVPYVDVPHKLGFVKSTCSASTSMLKDDRVCSSAKQDDQQRRRRGRYVFCVLDSAGSALLVPWAEGWDLGQDIIKCRAARGDGGGERC